MAYFVRLYRSIGREVYCQSLCVGLHARQFQPYHLCALIAL